MTLAPGVSIVDRVSPPARSTSIETGTWFVTGLTERGATTPLLVRSMADYSRHLGARVSYGQLYDALETYFREGGARAYVMRVLGPSALAAGVDLSDGVAPTLRISAASPGEWGNTLTVEVEAGSAGGTFVLVLADPTGELERSPDLADTAAAIAWAEYSAHVRASELPGAGDPVVVAATLMAAGTDDRAASTEADWAAALARAPKGLGPGQVSAPGRTTAQAHADLQVHAKSTNRHAIPDAPDTSTVATLLASGTSARAGSNPDRSSQLHAPWAIVPGIVAGTTRRVPYSAVQAGLIARLDRTAGVSEAAAGDLGRAVYALGVAHEFDEGARADLNGGGVNVARLLGGVVTTYGARTLVAPSDTARIGVGGARTRMLIESQADQVGDRLVFRRINDDLLTEFDGALRTILQLHYEAGALYGETADEAYAVGVREPINTTTTAALQELHAELEVRTAQHAERVVIGILRTAITEAI